MLYLKEFKQGLKLYGFSSILSKSPDACRDLFTRGSVQKVDANYLFSLVQPVYSAQGSSRRAVEEGIIDHFQDFLLSLEDEKVTGYSAPIAWREAEDGSSSEPVLGDQMPPVEHFVTPDLTPAGIMGWLTGQRHQPMNGCQMKITAKFCHDCMTENPNHTICFPHVGACGMEITFPVQHMRSFKEFKDIFLLAYCKGQQFGRP